MSKMQKLSLLAAVVLVIIGSGFKADAWNFNHSYLNPKLDITKTGFTNPVCGSSGQLHSTYTHADTCCQSGLKCVGYDSQGQCYKKVCAGVPIPVKVLEFGGTVNVPTVNETCYHPTCYIRAANEIKRYPMPVQPLTNDTNSIIKAVDNITDGKVGAEVGYDFYYHYPVDFHFTDEQGKYVHVDYSYVVGMNFMKKWGVATGTSAMQGLLWSWRMLSSKWHGVWTPQSEFETSASAAFRDARVDSIPNSANSKNIVIISDGIDSDGPSYLGGSIPSIVSATGDGSIGFTKVDQYDATSIFETCDAHVPLASIKYEDYINDVSGPKRGICNRMKDEGVRVNVVLYLYTTQDVTNSPLIACADLTGGLKYTKSNPDTISADLNNLIASIATRDIRLVK